MNKKDKRGIVVRYKARLVAQGYTQEEGKDYVEVFLQVLGIEANLGMFLKPYASFMNFVVYQMDVKSAFLYGKIEEEVYVCQLPGFEDPEFPDKVYKVMQKEDGIFISQDKYVVEILKKFGFSIVKTASTPMETSMPLMKDANAEDVESSVFIDIVADEAVHKELGDSLVRAATTASSLKAEQNSGNITKTRSKATPNDAGSLGTTSGGGPRVDTLRSKKDSMKLKELMEFYTKLSERVLDSG
ncbi:copia protein [Tanacetum coccineum]